MSPAPPDHVEATVQRLADIHAKAVDEVSALDRGTAAVITALARPRVQGGLLAVVLSWMGYNAAAAALGTPVFDPPPFAALELGATVVALFTTLLILAAQRREETQARRRAQLTLQLATLSEQKVAKVIALLEEQRRENPLLPSRVDREADDLAHPADPERVLDRIIETHEGSDDISPVQDAHDAD